MKKFFNLKIILSIFLAGLVSAQAFSESQASSEADGKKTLIIIALAVAFVCLSAMALVIFKFIASSRATQMQTEQLDSTLKLIEGMQEVNSQFMEEKESELNQLAIACEK